MKTMTGYDRARIIAHWVKTKPVNKDNEPILMENYIKAVCKEKGWTYRKGVKK